MADAYFLDCNSFASVEAKKEELKRKDPALRRELEERDEKMKAAYEKLAGDWTMAEFFEDMQKDAEMWWNKYKDDKYVMNRVFRAAGIPGEGMYLDTPAGYPVTPKADATKGRDIPLGLSHGPILSKQCSVGTKIDTKMSGLIQLEVKTEPSSSVMYQKPDPGMLLRAQATMIPNKEDISCQLQVNTWVFFSAFSVMGGNVGQGNYSAANAALHAPTNLMRTARAFCAASCVQWGAIGGIGMRWKAFATQDMLNATPDALFSVADSAMMLKVTCASTNHDTPDQVAVFLFDAATRAALVVPPVPGTLATTLGKPTAGAAVESARVASTAGEKGINTALIMSLSDPANRSVEVSSIQMIAGGQPDVGKEVRLSRMRAAPEFNGLKGVITEDLGAGKWLVRLDDALVEDLIRTGYSKPAEPEKVVPAEAKKPSVISGSGKDAYTIAGTWDGHIPHDMEWNEEDSCYKFYAEVGRKTVSFYIVRGRAGEKKLKYKGKTWSIPGNSAGTAWYEIRLFVKDTGTVNKVEWQKGIEPPAASMAMVTNGDAE